MFLKKLTHYYIHDMKLNKKLTLSHLLIGLLPSLILTIFMFTNISGAVINNTLRSENALVNQTADSVSDTVSRIMNVTNSLITDIDLSRILSTASSSELVDNDYLQTVQESIDGTVITDIQFYLPEAYDFCWQDILWADHFQSEANASGSYWHGIFSGTDRISLLCPTFYLSSSEIENYGSMAYIYKLTDVGPEAYVAVYFSEKFIQQTLSNIMDNSSTNTAVSYIINERNALVSTSSRALYGTHILAYEDVPSIIENSSDFSERVILGEHVYMAYRTIRNSNWYLISVIPTESVFGERNFILGAYLLAFLFLFIAVYKLSMWLANSIVHRIYNLMQHMNSVRFGEPVFMQIDTDEDEIGKLIDSYNYMTGEIHAHREREQQISKELQLSEFRALQAQINPHFLYNMLDMINWLAKSNDTEKVCKSVTALSQFYKLTLNRGHLEVRIEEELLHVSLYVELQNMRYDNQIQFIVDVPDEILDYKIPNLVLQPIVENAILHGIFEKESKSGTIVIMAWVEDEEIIFTISDDGVGIPEHIRQNLLTGTLDNGKGSNIGIYNTHKRLQLYYNSEFGLSYKSEPGMGTEVTLKIPMHKPK